MRQLVITCSLVLALASTSPAATHLVAADGTGDFPTIQAAIDASTHGDVIELTNGTFRGDGNRDVDFSGKALTVRSQSGDRAACIIDCEGGIADPHRAFVFRSGEGPGSLLEGVTIANGYVTGPDWYLDSGGGVWCESSSPRITDCLFASNTSQRGGGGMAGASASPTLTGCVFVDNEATAGGGLIFMDPCPVGSLESTVAGATSAAGNPTGVALIDCLFYGNSASSGGGGIESWCAPLDLTGCAFHDNVADLGGGINCYEPSLTLRGCTLAGNTAGTEGGALRCDFVHGLDVTVEHCTLAANSATTGGGVYFASSIFVPSPAATFDNTIIAGSPVGAAIHFDDTYEPCDPTLTCCDLYGNAGGDWTEEIADQLGIRGNVARAPLFCDAADDDFTLHADSPCAPEQSGACGLIGAWPVGCEAAAVASTEVLPLPPLLRVYPQPVRPGSVVEWRTIWSAPRLRLYDPTGRLVATAEPPATPGSGRLRWNELVDGSRLAAGIYFLELDGPARVEATRIVVLR